MLFYYSFVVIIWSTSNVEYTAYWNELQSMLARHLHKADSLLTSIADNHIRLSPTRYSFSLLLLLTRNVKCFIICWNSLKNVKLFWILGKRLQTACVDFCFWEESWNENVNEINRNHLYKQIGVFIQLNYLFLMVYDHQFQGFFFLCSHQEGEFWAWSMFERTCRYQSPNSFAKSNRNLSSLYIDFFKLLSLSEHTKNGWFRNNRDP